jgi:hypothetical protein
MAKLSCSKARDSLVNMTYVTDLTNGDLSSGSH